MPHRLTTKLGTVRTRGALSADSCRRTDEEVGTHLKSTRCVPLPSATSRRSDCRLEFGDIQVFGRCLGDEVDRGFGDATSPDFCVE